MRRWSEDEIEKLKEYAKSGKSLKECSVVLNRDEATTWIKLRELGLNESREEKDRKRLKILKECQGKNLTREEISDILGVHPNTVLSIYKKFGLDKKHFEVTQKEKFGLDKKHFEGIRKGKLRDENKVKKRFGISNEVWAKMSNAEIEKLCFKCPIAECDNCIRRAGETR